MIRLIVGLGNPGSEYAQTRHNAGFWFVDEVADRLKVSLAPERSYFGIAARTSVSGRPLWLLMPTTYMNLSGKSVAALARFFKIAPDEILVAHDELDLQPGQVRLKLGGSHAGHNGLKDIHAQLGSGDHWRQRTRTRWVYMGMAVAWERATPGFAQAHGRASTRRAPLRAARHMRCGPARSRHLLVHSIPRCNRCVGRAEPHR